jgi:hypothetical protein
MSGISDRLQAILVMISGAFMAVGTAGAAIPDFVPQDFRWQFAVIFWIAGIIGFGIQQGLGAKPTPQKTS